MNMSMRSNFKVLMVLGVPATAGFAALGVIHADFVFAVFAVLLATLELIGVLALTTNPGQGASIPPAPKQPKTDHDVAVEFYMEFVLPLKAEKVTVGLN